MSSSTLLVLFGILLLRQACLSSNVEGGDKDQKQSQLLQITKKIHPLYKNAQELIKKNETSDEPKKNCVYRIEDGDMLIGVNKTREEIESEGKKIYDEVCEGDLDPNGDKISSGALASLCCG